MKSDEEERPLVSLVLAVLNGASTIERCLDKIRDQTLSRRELIVKDGGSGDGTLDILMERRDELAFWCSEPDRGLYDAWNRVLGNCRGEYVCFLGCDDELATSNTLEMIATAVERATEKPDLVCSLVAVTDTGGRFLKAIGAPWNWHAMRQQQVVAHPGMWHRTSLFTEYGAFDPAYRIAGDYEFLLRLPPQTKSLFLDQVTVRMGANGMSHHQAVRTIRETRRAQAAHPSIGPLKASVHFGVNMSKLVAKRVLGYR